MPGPPYVNGIVHDNGMFVDYVARLIWINLWHDQGFWIGQRLERSQLMDRGASSANLCGGSAFNDQQQSRRS